MAATKVRALLIEDLGFMTIFLSDILRKADPL